MREIARCDAAGPERIPLVSSRHRGGRTDDAATGGVGGISRDGQADPAEAGHRAMHGTRRLSKIVAARKKNDSQGIAGHVSRHPRAIHRDVRRAPARRAIHGHQPAAADDGIGKRQARLFERDCAERSKDRFRRSAGRHRAAPAGWASSAATSTSQRSMRTRRSG